MNPSSPHDSFRQDSKGSSYRKGGPPLRRLPCRPTDDTPRHLRPRGSALNSSQIVPLAGVFDNFEFPPSGRAQCVALPPWPTIDSLAPIESCLRPSHDGVRRPLAPIARFSPTLPITKGGKTRSFVLFGWTSRLHDGTRRAPPSEDPPLLDVHDHRWHGWDFPEGHRHAEEKGRPEGSTVVGPTRPPPRPTTPTGQWKASANKTGVWRRGIR